MCGVSRCPAALWPHANMAGHLVRVLLNPCMCNSTGLLGKTRRLPHYLYTAASLFPSWQLKEVWCSKAANWASLLGVLSYDGVNKARKVADSLLIQLTQTISLTQFSILHLMYPPSLAGDTSMWMHVCVNACRQVNRQVNRHLWISACVCQSFFHLVFRAVTRPKELTSRSTALYTLCK